jgi:hypothetical protein
MPHFQAAFIRKPDKERFERLPSASRTPAISMITLPAIQMRTLRAAAKTLGILAILPIWVGSTKAPA